MRSSFAKSIYVGAAVLGLAGLSAVTTTTASAKSKAVKVTSSKLLTTNATTRNVTFTGTNALYTKPGTVKGAKVVASTTTAKKLAASKEGAANFRAYRVATTNRGSVYYKVVSFDGTYRGWIYGGKDKTAFAGGVASYDTTKDQTNSGSTFTLTGTTGTKNDLFFTSPAYAEYKVGRSKAVTDTSTYKNATLTFSATTKTSREGDTWYKVASVNNSTTDPAVGTWVKASNVKDNNALDASKEVAVTIKDVATGATVTTFNVTTGVTGVGADATDALKNSTTFASDVATKAKAAGYTVNTADKVNNITSAKNGDTIVLYGVKNGQNYSTPTAYANYTGDVNSSVTLSTTTSTDAVDSASDAQGKVLAPAGGTTQLFGGTDGTSFTADQALAFLNGSSYYKQLLSPKFKDADAKATGYSQYTLTPETAKGSTFGTAFTATYKVTKTTNVAAPTTATTPDTTGTGNPFA
ncbi:hypothetical protein [Levilactobacillus brevis]|uniref:hypothetical protein n=1 Tax=Levilactobacillus brevis TaxID=1580 RepID=UPI003EBBCBFC